MRSAWVVVPVLAALACNGTPSDAARRGTGGAGAADAVNAGNSAGGDGPQQAYELDDTPLDGIDSNGDGYDFPVMLSSADPMGVVAACPSLPAVTLPALMPRDDCSGQPDLVIGWVSDCIKCFHAIELVVGNRGVVPVDVNVNVSIRDEVEPSVSAGVVPPLSWSQPIHVDGYYDMALQVSAMDGGATCDPTEASVRLPYSECLPK